MDQINLLNDFALSLKAPYQNITIIAVVFASEMSKAYFYYMQ